MFDDYYDVIAFAEKPYEGVLRDLYTFYNSVHEYRRITTAGRSGYRHGKVPVKRHKRPDAYKSA